MAHPGGVLKVKRPSSRRAPSQDRARVTREAIVIAADRVLVGEGAEALTTNRVAEVAGVSVGTLYQYFPDKLAIVALLIERRFDEFFAAFAQILAAARALSIDDAARLMSRGMVAFARSQTYRATAELAAAVIPTGLGDREATLLRRYETALAGFLAARDDVRVDDPALAAAQIVSAAYGAAKRFFEHPDDFDEQAYLRGLDRMLLSYLRGA